MALLFVCCSCVFFFQAEDGIRGAQESRGLGDVYKRQVLRRDGTLDELVEPGIRVVTGGGKRLRPTLTIAAAAVGGAPANDHVTAAGVAVELVQVGSLVHDDLMDHAKTRRGVETVNAREGLNWAILVGDYLLAVAGIQAASVSKEVAHSLARTIADLAAGQGREVARQGDPHRSVADYEASIRGKTCLLYTSPSPRDS